MPTISHPWASSDPHDPELCPECNPDLDAQKRVIAPRVIAPGGVFSTGSLVLKLSEGATKAGTVFYDLLIASDKSTATLTLTPLADGTVEIAAK
jgi:hypothetical protein